ncbi:TPA: hypothetical protein ACH3X1_005607 [Trebouxia sp. C0004]
MMQVMHTPPWALLCEALCLVATILQPTISQNIQGHILGSVVQKLHVLKLMVYWSVYDLFILVNMCVCSAIRAVPPFKPILVLSCCIASHAAQTMSRLKCA